MTNNNSTPEVTLESLYDVPVQISVVLGRNTMSFNISTLGKGAVIELERGVGEPIDVC